MGSAFTFHGTFPTACTAISIVEATDFLLCAAFKSKNLTSGVEATMTQASSTADFIKLSEREQEVLRLLAEGWRNREIAAKLHLSPHTVKTHVRGIMNKLGVNHRIQAVVFALRNGLV